MQVFYDAGRRARASRSWPSVGRLQFEVVQFRLKNEYGVETVLEPTPFRHVRWLEGRRRP